MKTGLKKILLCFSLTLLFLYLQTFFVSTLNEVNKNIPEEVFYTSSYEDGDSNFTPEFAIAADSNYKKGRIIRRYVSGAGLFVVIVVDKDSIVYI